MAFIGGIVVVLFVLVGTLAPLLSPHDPNRIELRRSLRQAQPGHWLGTDYYGRDLLSRIIHGARVSLVIGSSSIALGSITGVTLGLIAGYYPRANMPIMRVADIMLAFPGIIVALAIVALMGPGLRNVIIAIAIYEIPQYVRLVNGSVLAIREMEYIDAARAIGQRDGRIIRRHILPNCLSPIIVQSTLLFPSAIMTAASLSFLGLGVQPPTPEWGAMLSQSREYLPIAPHLMVYPGLALALVVFGFNTFGDGLRDALDPRFRTSGAGSGS